MSKNFVEIYLVNGQDLCFSFDRDEVIIAWERFKRKTLSTNDTLLIKNLLIKSLYGEHFEPKNNHWPTPFVLLCEHHNLGFHIAKAIENLLIPVVDDGSEIATIDNAIAYLERRKKMLKQD